MKAELFIDRRITLGDDAFADIRIWRVPIPVSATSHVYKYSLAYVVGQKCILRYDKERGKGDHRHLGEIESPYVFSDIRRLVRDFFKDIEEFEQ